MNAVTEGAKGTTFRSTLEFIRTDRGEAEYLRVLAALAPDARTPLFCRRQTGGLAQAIEIAGGEKPVVRHVRCALQGDAFCEWELGWEVGEARAMPA